ncbi:NAD nucleotidase [Desulfobacter sp.]|uniref:NAD nucleotidase n=1 Tax=Desulfobacter sp. TaxID=2294 RepID=UPI003D0F3E00
MQFNPAERQLFKAVTVLFTLMLLFVAGCNDGDKEHQLVMKILHINDVHSNLEASDVDLSFEGVETACQVGGMAKIASKISELKEETDNCLILHAGDAVQGTLFYTLFQGKADVDVMNAIGFDAMAIGNHEFDDGDAWLAGFIRSLTCPVLSANIEVPSGNVLYDLYEPYIIKKVDGKQVGIIGLTIAGKTRNSSHPSDKIVFEDEVEATQDAVDELTAQGVKKIILLSHYGYENVLALAGQVSDIDVIVDGDSHTLLGDFSAYDLDASGDYPTMTTNADGEKVAVVQAWEYSKALGELDVTFDGDVLESCTGTPHMILGDTFTRKGDDGEKYTLKEDEFTAVQALVDADARLDIVSDDKEVAAIIAGYAEKVDGLGETVIGTAGEDLLHNRVPGHAYNGVTLDFGSRIAPVVAKAFYEMDSNADVCIQNGGGVRISVYQGDIIYDTAYTLLPFSNTLFEISMYGSEIKSVLEDAVENIARGGGTGSFPYCYALKYDVDATRAYGSRIINIEFKDRQTGKWSDLDERRMYVVVTNNYTAGGKDGYATFASVQEERGEGTNTYLDDALSFVNYVKQLTGKGETLTALPDEDHCIKSYTTTADQDDDL